MRFFRTMAVVGLCVMLTGCLFRTRKVDQRLFTGQLKEATLQELVQRINSEADKIKTLNATVDIATSVGGQKRGKVTEYAEIRGYVLFRKPGDLRMIGLFPVVRNRAFDMVSDGDRFKLSIPSRNKFFVGRNEVTRPSPQPLENLRPHHITDALLLHDIHPDDEIAFLETGVEAVPDPQSRKDVDVPTYIVTVIREGQDDVWRLSRKIVFSRLTLQPTKQIVYDQQGKIATEATYQDFEDFAGMLFPQVISIERPQEEYEITLKIVKLRLNEQLKNDQFALEQPQGAQVVDLDKRAAAQVNPPQMGATTAPPAGGKSKGQ